jgi:uncharacterized protein YerC
MFAELGIGPGHRAFRDEFDDDRGLIAGSSFAKAMCRPCASESATLALPNPWFTLREQLAADDPGGSVKSVPVSQIVSSNENDDDGQSQSEAIDQFLSVNADNQASGSLTANEYRDWMRKFLIIADSRVMTSEMRKVCELWASGKKQSEISVESGISQATVSRLIRDGKDLLYSRMAKAS